MRVAVMTTACAVLALAACGGGEGGEQTASAPAAEDSSMPAAAATAAAPAAVPASFSGPRPGLWRIVRHDAEGAGEPEEKCVTAEESARIARDPLASMEMGEGCTHKMTSEGGGTVIRATCPQNTTAELRTRGDFQNSYTMDIAIRLGNPERTEIKARVEGARIGDC